MPILNLSKIKKEPVKEEPKEDVPDELPSLPTEEPQKEGKKEDKSEQKAEQPVVQAAPSEPKQEVHTLAPDELPPLQSKTEPLSPPKEEKSEIVQVPSKKEELKPKILDERLYFAQLIKRLNEGVSLEEIEKEIKSKDILSALQDNISHNKKSDSKSLLEREIKSMISDLQKLEKEWGMLKLELEQKKLQFESIEKKIKDSTEIIKHKFTEMDELRKQF